jgi:Gram-negative bacterial TonB protein C-terminal
MFKTFLFATALLSLIPQGSQRTCVLHLVTMPYPVMAHQANIQGKIHVRALIGADGHVIGTSAVSGSVLLRNQAEENLRLWVFNPGDERTVDVEYEFVLEEPHVRSPATVQMSFDLPGKVYVYSNPLIPDHAR